MNKKELYSILEIEPTDNIKEIKRAYAKAIRKYHPEENPEEWKRVHDAYEQLIDKCKKRLEESNQTDFADIPLSDQQITVSNEAKNIENSKNNEESKNVENAEGFEDIEKIAQQSEIKYQKDNEREAILKQKDVEEQNKYYELLQNVRKAFSVKGTRGGREVIADYEYTKVRNMPLFLEALENKSFAEAYSYIVQSSVIEDTASLKMIRDLETAKQKRAECASVYDEIIIYLEDSNNIYSSVPKPTTKSKIVSAVIIIVFVIIVVCRILLSLNDTKDDYEPQTYTFGTNRIDRNLSREILENMSNMSPIEESGKTQGE